MMRNIAAGGSTGTSCADTAITAPPAIRNTRKRATEASAARTPWRSACQRLLSSVGRISPASARSGGRIVLSPAMSTMGMANPTSPLITPATSATATAKTAPQSDNARKTVSMPKP